MSIDMSATGAPELKPGETTEPRLINDQTEWTWWAACPACGKVNKVYHPGGIWNARGEPIRLRRYCDSRPARREKRRPCISDGPKAELREARRRSCETCGSVFIGTRADARFCSGKCRQRAYRSRVTADLVTHVDDSPVTDVTDKTVQPTDYFSCNAAGGV